MEILPFNCFRRNIVNLRSFCLKLIVISARNAVDLAHTIHGPQPGQGGTPIIVLHGLLGSKKNWQSMCKKITSTTSKCVVAADVRNHGESPHDPSHTYHDLASDVSQLMKKLDINDANLIGHSMGGRTAMVLALTEPAKVKSAIIVDISPVSSAGLNDYFPNLIKAMKSINFNGMDFGKARNFARQQIKASGLVNDDGMMSFVVMNVQQRRDGKVGWICNLDALLKHFISDIRSFPNFAGTTYNGPVLFIGGEQSTFIPPADLNGIRGLFPKAELKYVKGVGHNVHAEDPATFFNMTIEFLKNK